MGARLRGLESAHAQAQGELRVAEQRAVALQAQLRQAVSERDDARGGARAAQDGMGARIAALTRKVGAATKRAEAAEALNTEVAELTRTVGALSAERSANRALIGDLEAQLEAAAEISAEDQHVAELTEARLVCERDEALRSGGERADALEANLVVMSSELEAAKATLAESEGVLAKSASRGEVEKAELLRRIESLQRDLAASEVKAREMEAAARKSESDARVAASRADRAAEQVRDVTARLEVCEINRTDLQDVLRRGGFEGGGGVGQGVIGEDGGAGGGGGGGGSSSSGGDFGGRQDVVGADVVVVQNTDAPSSAASFHPRVVLLETQLRGQQREFDAVKSTLDRQLLEKTSEVDGLIARQVAFEAEIAERDGALEVQQRLVRDLEGVCARLEQEKFILGDKARRLSDELSDFKVAAEFEGAAVSSGGGKSDSSGGSDGSRGFRYGGDAFARFSFEIVRKIEVTFDEEPSSLGVGLAQMARGSQLTVIRTINEGTKSKPTGAGVHNQAITEGEDEDRALEPGMVLIGINRVSTVNMSYEDAITAIKRLPRPISLLFGVIQLEKASKAGGGQ